MRQLYTNQGAHFGYRDEGYLFTYLGKCVGVFKEGKIFRKNGEYLGELSKLNYLVVDQRNKNLSIESWDHADGEKTKEMPFQFGRIGVGSLKYVDFPDVEQV